MKKNPRIINVVELDDNSVTGIDTFVIPDGIRPHSKEENEVVTVAEKLFVEIAKENGMSDFDTDACLEDGFYQNDTYKVILQWSNENTHLKVK